ncbi:hypothetical protein BSZ39_10550 [Bowdeniella nasicola]|uniref:Beta-galactosidase n=1 Tax=Bowdeniella nasicola TaxID=208480 RepID=A0A1Q5Q029_9ACTO|nr:beta-galactosidase [Bowdeniella nasicola]OKL53238.1 hypothetical protein BSZ39_10550 [Bowdeniella nasicola]
MAGIIYGADYNPEQWNAQVRERDVELMKEAGLSLASVGVFSWARLEIADGEFDFGWLDEVIENLAAAGIGIDLATATASPPAWLTTAHPEILPVTEDGVRLAHGSRQDFCPSSPVFRRYAARLAGKLAERYGTHPALKLWHISNEYGCHSVHCYCETSAEAFRGWLLNKYGDLESLNEAWGTDFWSQRYTDITQVDVPRATPTLKNPGQVADFLAFSSDEMLACYLAEKEAIRAHSDVPVTTNFMGLFPHANYRDWAPHIDVISDDSYPDPATVFAAHETALVSDLMRSLKDGQPFYLLEQTTSAVQWRERNVRKRPGVFALQSLARIARGADAICQFQWRQSVRGAETFHSAMVPHAGRASRTFTEVCQLGDTLKRLGPAVGARVKTTVALLIDWASIFHRAAAIGPGPDRGLAAISAWHRTAFERGYPVDFVFPDSDLSAYRVIIVPELFAMSKATADALTAAAEGGAQIIVTAPSAVVDETGKAYEGGYAAIISDLLGIVVLDHHLVAEDSDQLADPRVDRISSAITPALDQVNLETEPSSALFRVLDRMSHPRPALAGGIWAEEIAISDGVEALATFAGGDLSGLPAITYRAASGGGGTYVATDLESVGRAAIFQLAELRARITGERLEMPDGVEAIRRGDVVFVLNHGDSAAQIAGLTGHDLVSDSVVTGHLVVPPRSAAAIDVSSRRESPDLS